MAPDRPNARPELAAALDTLDQLTAATSPRPASPPQPAPLHSQCPPHRPGFTVPPDSGTPSPAVKLRTNVQTLTPEVP
jgi:hypothetical protein